MRSKLVILIAAISENRALGHESQIPWKIDGEQRHFKQVTMGNAIIMGRKTYESIGRALPGRTNIVITNNRDFTAPDCLVMYSVSEAIEFAKGLTKDVFVIGGASIYIEAMPLADQLHLTLVPGVYTADTYFPEIPSLEFVEHERRMLGLLSSVAQVKYRRIKFP